jgi:hypothetical protein
MSDDKAIFRHIEELVGEEHKLRAKVTSGETPESDEERSRLRQLEIELDRTWDLLRQRRAKREFGQDPESAQERSSDTVEGYFGN